MPEPAPPPTYTLRTVGDFLAVPVDRLDACLADFRDSIEAAKGIREAVVAITEQEHGPGCVGPEVLALNAWTWTDDGERKMNVRFNAMEKAADA